MNLPLLPQSPECKECICHNTARSVGIATVRVNEVDTPHAIVMVGLFPGLDEDRSNSVMTGPSGLIVRNAYIKSHGLSDLATIYLTNGVRCNPGPSKPPAGAYKKCGSIHLLRDLQEIANAHSKVHVLCMGAGPAQFLYKHAGLKSASLARCITHQGTPLSLPSGAIVTLFATYNAAQILVTNGLKFAVNDHLGLLADHIRGVSTTPLLSPPTIVPPGPPPKGYPQ